MEAPLTLMIRDLTLAVAMVAVVILLQAARTISRQALYTAKRVLRRADCPTNTVAKGTATDSSLSVAVAVYADSLRL